MRRHRLCAAVYVDRTNMNRTMHPKQITSYLCFLTIQGRSRSSTFTQSKAHDLSSISHCFVPRYSTATSQTTSPYTLIPTINGMHCILDKLTKRKDEALRYISESVLLQYTRVVALQTTDDDRRHIITIAELCNTVATFG